MKTELIPAFDATKYTDYVRYNNIPTELRERRQWVVASEDKIPINPLTGLPASPTNPADCGSFEDAIEARIKFSHPYIGYVLNSSDPYCIIDLDDKAENPASDEQLERFKSICNQLNSYTEISSSGRGLHIVCKGNIPRGVKRDHVEMYSSDRYMIFTGNKLSNAPIAERQELIEAMFQQMDHGSSRLAELSETESNQTDEQLLTMARNATNADKFKQLWDGNWQGEYKYPSPSEADYALLSMLCFYSRSNEQVRRLFRLSGLGKRDKAQRDGYLNTALAKIRATQPPEVDFSQLKTNLTSKPKNKNHIDSLASFNEFPPGLVGEIAAYIQSSSIRPVREFSLASAIALVSGISGRCYNVSGTGLNLYIMVLGATGTGKEGTATAIDTLMSFVRSQVPMADDFIGPGTFASGQALIRTLDNKTCFLSVMGEIGLTLQKICDKRATSADVMFRKVLLDLYTKSGWGKILRSTAYSETDKNTKIVQSPCVTILGEGTPNSFFEAINEYHIAEGLIPRFTVIEYKGLRPPKNKNAFHPPSEQLIYQLSNVACIAIKAKETHVCYEVAMDEFAQSILDEFDVYADEQINSDAGDTSQQLWNRAHLKALKLSAVVAIGVNPSAPVITTEIAQWAISLTKNEINNMLRHVLNGDFGADAVKRSSEIIRLCKEYLSYDKATKKKKGKCPPMALGHNVIPHTWLYERAARLACFKDDPKRSVTETISLLFNCGEISRLPKEQVFENFKSTAKLYVLGELE